MFQQPSLKALNTLCTKEQFLNDKANPVNSDNQSIRLQHRNMQGFQNNNKQYFIAKFTGGMWAYHLALHDC